MPQPHCIEVLLDLEDTGIKILEDSIRKVPTKHGIQKVIEAKLSPSVYVCPRCGCMDGTIIKHGTKVAHIKLSQVTECDTYLRIRKQRYYCKDCGRTFTASTKLVDKGCFIANSVKTAILLKAQETVSQKTLAKEAGVSHQTVYRILQSSGLETKKSFDYLPNVLSMDEFKSVKNAEGAMSFIVGDPLQRELIDIVEDRRLSSLIRYFHRYPLKARQHVKAVIIDMYDPYIQLVRQCFPNADIVIDKFHLVQHLNRAMNKIRIEAMKRFATDSLDYRLLKDHWKLLLKPVDTLGDDFRYSYKLKRYISSLELAELLASLDDSLKEQWTAYQLLLGCLRDRDAQRFFYHLKRYRGTLHPHLSTVIETFLKLEKYIHNTFRTSLTNGFIEGMNNKIKLIKRVSYGYRSFVNFRTRIMICFTLTKKIAQPLR